MKDKIWLLWATVIHTSSLLLLDKSSIQKNKKVLEVSTYPEFWMVQWFAHADSFFPFLTMSY